MIKKLLLRLFVIVTIVNFAPCAHAQPLETSPLSNEPKPVPFEKISLHIDWRLKSSFNYSAYKGVFRNENDLKKIWKYMINAYDEYQPFWKKNENQPVMPLIDFDKYSVIWYADRGSNASFANLKKVLEYDSFMEANVTLFYSDFGSSHLNLWTIPKTDKDIQFIEIKEHERSGFRSPAQNTAFDLNFSVGGSIFGSSFEAKISGANITYLETTQGGTREVKKIERTLSPDELEDIRKTILETNLLNLQSESWDFSKPPIVTDQASYGVSLSIDGKKNSISCYITPAEIAPPSECEKQLDKLRLKLNSILGVGIY